VRSLGSTFHVWNNRTGESSSPAISRVAIRESRSSHLESLVRFIDPSPDEPREQRVRSNVPIFSETKHVVPGINGGSAGDARNCRSKFSGFHLENITCPVPVFTGSIRKLSVGDPASRVSLLHVSRHRLKSDVRCDRAQSVQQATRHRTFRWGTSLWDGTFIRDDPRSTVSFG